MWWGWSSFARRRRSGTSGRESAWESTEVEVEAVLAEDDEDLELDVSGEGDEDSDEDVAVSDRVLDAGTQEGKSVVGAGKSANSKSSSLGGGNLMSVV